MVFGVLKILWRLQCGGRPRLLSTLDTLAIKTNNTRYQFHRPYFVLFKSQRYSTSNFNQTMDSTPSSQVVYEIPTLFQVYKDGRVERFRKHDFAPPSDNPVTGDSAGANIAHNMMMRASVDEDKLGDGLRLVGMALIHPYFGNNEPDRIWSYCCLENPKTDDPRFNPAAHSNLLSKLVCSKILICTGEKDYLRDRGWTHYEALKKCGWKGEVDIKESEEEEHGFHLDNPNCERAKALMKWLADFFHQSS